MKYFRSSPAARLFFLVVSANIWLGIWLTGPRASPRSMARCGREKYYTDNVIQEPGHEHHLAR